MSGTGWAITSATNVNPITYTAGSGGRTGTFTLVITDGNNGCTSSCTVSFGCQAIQGCTPGFWKTHPELWDQTSDPYAICVANTIASLGAPYSGNGTTNSLFVGSYGLTSAQMGSAGLSTSLTMIGAMNLGGGGFNKLARNAVAGVLSACALTGYPYTPTHMR